jgi:5-methylcytosine-specific restriction endonuclease McrA
MATDLIPQLREIVTYTQARERGLRHYFTGKPCMYGHVAIRLASTGMCQECARLRQRKWRVENLELARQRYREWKSNNPDVAKAATASWRNRNPDKVIKYAATGYARNKAKRLAWQAIYNLKNRDKILARVTKWQLENPEKVKLNKRNWNIRHPEQVQANGSVCAARRRNAVGRFTADDIAAIFKAQRGKCAYCRKSIKDRYDIDHIIALINGGSNWPSNIQLCCENCNQRKSSKDPIDFARSFGQLL